MPLNFRVRHATTTFPRTLNGKCATRGPKPFQKEPPMLMGGVNGAASQSEKSSATDESGFNLLEYTRECEFSYRMPLVPVWQLAKRLTPTLLWLASVRPDTA
jgi:hypothetical protein